VGGRIHGSLEGKSTYQIVVGHMIRIVDVTHVLVVLFHNVKFHGVVAVVTTAGGGSMSVSM